TIARNFLAAHSEVFGMEQGQVAQMRMMNEDNDKGTTFVNYEQTVNGIPVFQGQVQVAIGQNGQVMSVMEGMLVPEVEMSTAPEMSEQEALRQSFLYAGRQMPASFEMMQARPTAGERAIYRNPIGGTRENLLSGLAVMRVGQQAVLAYHTYVDVGP